MIFCPADRHASRRLAGPPGAAEPVPLGETGLGSGAKSAWSDRDSLKNAFAADGPLDRHRTDWLGGEEAILVIIARVV